MQYKSTLDFARSMDEADALSVFRSKFYIPQHNGKPSIYLCGNSLGLQPKSAREFVEQELKDWELFAVEGHFQGKNPWFHYHTFLTPYSAELVGAKEIEVVVMNSLTVNVNLLLLSFYQPKGKRNKILIEWSAFPSDYYAVEQQIRLHGLRPEDCLVEMMPEPGETLLRTELILQKIQDIGDELALVFMGGVNYYTGQFYQLQKITEAAHKTGAYCGFDLAHTAGNLPLQLHDWNVDFAAWCTYKYLNSGPGGTSGIFVHERHADKPELPRLAGWWGNDPDTRFSMNKHFVPAKGAAGWQQSNAQILPMAVHRASLEIFHDAGMKNLRAKSIQLTRFLEFLISESESNGSIQIISPQNPDERGCQLSLRTNSNGRKLFKSLTEAGVIADWREPDVIRIAPVPLYNTFEDVYHFAQLLKQHNI